MFKKSVLLKAIALACFLHIAFAQAYEMSEKKYSYLDKSHLYYTFGLGSTQLVHGNNDITSRMGPSLRFAVGHHINQNVSAELYYQWSMFKIRSLDPIALGGRVQSKTGSNEFVIRSKYAFSQKRIQPYIGAGIGAYSIYGEDRFTALNFDWGLQIPVSAGVKTYYYKDRFSIDLDFTYKFVFGENQSQTRLNLLQSNKVSFNSISLMLLFSFNGF